MAAKLTPQELEEALKQIKAAEDKALWEEVQQAERARARQEREAKDLQDQLRQIEEQTKAMENKALQEQIRQLEAQAVLEKEQLKADEEYARSLSGQNRAQKEQASNDAAIAQAYADSLSGGPIGERKKSAEQQAILDRDLAIATAEQDKEHQMSPEAMAEQLFQYQQFILAQQRKKDVPAQEWQKMSDEIQAILNSPAVVGEYEPGKPGVLTDAHKYTSTLIRNGLPILYAIDNKFKLSRSDISVEQILKEVLEHVEKANKNNSNISMDNIKKTFALLSQHKGLEGETQTDPFQLLSRTWDLAKKIGPAAMTQIVSLFSDNIGDGGGCIAGLCARLYAPYARMIGMEFNMAPTVKQAQKP